MAGSSPLWLAQLSSSWKPPLCESTSDTPHLSQLSSSLSPPALSSTDSHHPRHMHKGGSLLPRKLGEGTITLKSPGDNDGMSTDGLSWGAEQEQGMILHQDHHHQHSITGGRALAWGCSYLSIFIFGQSNLCIFST